MASHTDAAARERRLEMQHLQAIEGNPLEPAGIAMFEMFEREGWSFERRRAHIAALFERPAASNTISTCVESTRRHGIDVSIRAHEADYAPMGAVILFAVEKPASSS